MSDNLNKTRTFSKYIKAVIDGTSDTKFIDLVKMILLECAALAKRDKMITQLNPTYYDLITTLVHIDENHFKIINTDNVLSSENLNRILLILEPNINTLKVIGSYPTNPNSQYSPVKLTFKDPSKSNCGCGK